MSDDPRPCGTCYACCVWLGITELKKWPGRSCKHLDWRDPERRCSIYADRPSACSVYQCGYKQGLLDPDTGRPDKSGLLITTRRQENADGLRADVMVIDAKKAGTLAREDADKPLARLVYQLLNSGIAEIMVLDYQARSGFHFLNGVVRRGVILHPGRGNYEGLLMAEDDTPIATYEQLTPEELAEKSEELLKRATIVR